MLKRFSLPTESEGMIDITRKVADCVDESGCREGYCLIFCPHTTAAITINENADPDVQRDILIGLARYLPHQADFLHGEGNSCAHIKSSLVGASELVMITEGRLLLGTWLGIYFCEFDGPRTRTFYVKVVAG